MLAYALVTTGFWGVWGAFTGLPPIMDFLNIDLCGVGADHDSPGALRFAASRLAPAARCTVAMLRRLDRAAGGGGQMLLFHAVRTGPAYLIFPVISLSPVSQWPCRWSCCMSALASSARWASCWPVFASPVRLLGGTSSGGYGQLWFLPA